MNYFVFDFTTGSSDDAEMLTALIADLPFDTFEDSEQGFKAYIPENLCDDAVTAHIEALQSDFNFQFQKTFIPYQNWNIVWESNFQPLVMDNFVGLRADFHEAPSDVQFDLVINPKMAFGTGHHETTWMMMQLMRDLDFQDKSVFDYGCGTGVLAILAAKLGATPVEGVDNEYPAYESTLENAARNEVPLVKSVFGTLDNYDASAHFDIILANINRNVIIDSLAQLSKMLSTDGLMLISGFIATDNDIILENIQAHGFVMEKTLHRGNWLAMQLRKQ